MSFQVKYSMALPYSMNKLSPHAYTLFPLGQLQGTLNGTKFYLNIMPIKYQYYS